MKQDNDQVLTGEEEQGAGNTGVPGSVGTTNRDNFLKFGKILAAPPPGDEVVISGLAGSYPNSHNVKEFQEKLFNNDDLLCDGEQRWTNFHPEIPQRTGKLFNIEKYDCAYFGTHFRQANSMDPMLRIFLEKSIEAIVDAGVNPKDLEGTNTGVFVGACFSETESGQLDELTSQAYSITGIMRSIIPNRLSYYLRLKGPSYTTDTACSSSMYALEHAYRAIRSGKIEAAIVGGTNLCLHPFTSLQFARLGVLSKDGSCKVFDETGNGYARSEAISAVFLQRAKDAKRIYAHIVHARSNCDGFKQEGITFPSGEAQKMLMDDFYDECKVDPRQLSYLEAHGTGTKVGDPEEVLAIDKVFCTNRETPLLIGSVKSNIGHSEPSSGLCSITKCIIANETGFIPPNLHYKTPRKGVKALEEGRLEVVTTKLPFRDNRGLIGVNSFGFGGANCHILLKWNTKNKEKMAPLGMDLPRLVCLSGRVPESINELLDEVKRSSDEELVGLLQSLFRTHHDYHVIRGFAIYDNNKELTRSNRYFSEKTPPLYFAFGESVNLTLDESLLKIKPFKNAMLRIEKLLGKQTLDKILFGLGKNNILRSIIIQIGMVDLLKDLKVVPDGIFGYSIGELVCAYYDEVLSLEQVLEAACAVNSLVTKFEKQSLVLVQANKAEVKQIIKENGRKITVITDNCILVQDLIENLRGNITKIQYDLTSFIDEDFIKTKSQLIKQLSTLIPNPKPWSSKRLAKPLKGKANIDYFVKALGNVDWLKNISESIDKRGVLLEFGSGQLELLLRNSSCADLDFVNIFTSTQHGSLATQFLQSLGNLYELGFNFDLDQIYDPVKFPVSRGTPMISPTMHWKHTQKWHVDYYTNESTGHAERKCLVRISHSDWTFLEGHVIDGRNLFPATGYLVLVWETLAQIKCVLTSSMRVCFENCKFLRASTVPKQSKLELIVMIQQETGLFEVTENRELLVSGRIYAYEDNEDNPLQLPLRVHTNPQGALMSTKDIYKELKLRGYNYSGSFREITNCDINASYGSVKWKNNFISFIDNMLQLKILSEDSRLLYVPTSITRLTIDAVKHLSSLGDAEEDEEREIPVYVDKNMDIIQSGGVEIRGLKANSIARRKQLAHPVLEKYEFIPNCTELNLENSVRVNMQLILDNILSQKLAIVELLDEASKEGATLLSPLIQDALEDLPLVQEELTILSKTSVEAGEIKVTDEKLASKTDLTIVILNEGLSRKIILQQALKTLKPNGFIISRESSFDPSLTADLNVFTIHQTPEETLLLINKNVTKPTPEFIKVTQDVNSWLPNLQRIVKNAGHAILYSEQEPLNGVIGLVNAIRREPGGQNIRSFYMVDAPLDFDAESPFFLEQINKGIAVNVFKNGQWGTYRHILLDKTPGVEVEHCYANTTVRGDLSSLKWLEGPLTHKSKLRPGRNLVYIYYASLNFRDIMLASGRINADVVSRNRLEQTCVLGFEYAGRDEHGNRVMGMVPHSSCASILEASPLMQWRIPDDWTMSEAATITVVYATCLYALLQKGKMRRGDSILIHSGTGGIGQAAIYLALHYGVKVYTTVGTPEKRNFLTSKFPQIKDNQIFNSRDLTFERDVMNATQGRGVDLVLNSLADEKLLASVRCLATGGHFLEIGKFDLANDHTLQLLLLNKSASFHGVMLDEIFNNNKDEKLIQDLMDKALAEGAVKPLNTNIFKMDELEKAYRFMASGTHTGKCMIEVRKEESTKNALATNQLFRASPQFYCNPHKTYIVIGGLGGFGMELADWLVTRGCQHLVLTTRTGIKTGYQAYRIGLWKSYGVNVIVSNFDVTTEAGCRKLLTQSGGSNPIDAIFNLAVVLKDSLLENQSAETFETSFAPKAVATALLDRLTRVLCPDLRHFVVFSSVSCGRGNAGQSNYAMSNSIMERICEARHSEGLPALAIQWGAIGDVGLVADMQENAIELEIGGTLQQSIMSCLNTLDAFLKQKDPIVSSMVVAQKRRGLGASGNIVSTVASILGLKDLSSVSLHSSLAELGLDSMTAVEIKQTLEREFDLFLSPSDIRGLTFAKLNEMYEQKQENGEGGKSESLTPEMLLKAIGNKETINIPEIKLETKEGAPKVIFLPGIESIVSTYEVLAKQVACEGYGFQLGYIDNATSIESMVDKLYPQIRKHLSDSEPFKIVGHSFGTLLAFEIITRLEAEGLQGHLISIDGSPMFMKDLLNMFDLNSDAILETQIICNIMGRHMPSETVIPHKEALFKCANLAERIQLGWDIADKVKKSPFELEHMGPLVIALLSRMKCILNYQIKYGKIKSKVTLIRSLHDSLPGVPKDYKLTELCEQPVEIFPMEGNHFSLLESLEVATFVNQLINGVTVVEEPPQQST